MSDTAIEALKYSEVPNSSDCINRQVAVDIVDFECGEWRGLAKTIIKKLEALPAVQPDHNADISKKVSISCGRENDLISRQAARHALCKAVHNGEDIPCENQTASCLWTGTRVCDYVREIDALPTVQPEPRWIPCGERLPEEKQSVLVTDGSVIWVCDIISTDEGYKWEDSHGYWLDLNEWIAWMKLPELYKEGDVE